MIRRLLLLLLLLCATPAHATVNEVFARNDYVGNASTTSFPYTFRIINQADVLVLLNGVLQTLNIEYTVLGVDNPGGGTVVFATAPLSGIKVALLRAQRFQQLSIYTPNEAFPAKRIEGDLDKNAMVDQRQEEEIGRALKFDPQSLYRNVFVDDPIAGQCLVWNAAKTRVVSTPCEAGAAVSGPVNGGGIADQVAFWAAPTTLAGDAKFLWNNLNKSLLVGTTPLGPQKAGNIFAGLVGPMDATGMNTVLIQTVQGDPSLVGLVTLGNDRVSLSSWNFRGTGANNPIYGANFGVVFNTDGVANGLEIDVQNDSATNYQGQALWLNGSTRAAGAAGTVGHRANAILIDTQDGSKWERGILFKEGFVANGATGSIEKMGIHFEQSQDSDFIVMQPRVGAGGNVAMKVTNPEFTLNRFEVLNNGTVRSSSFMTGASFPAFSFSDSITNGMYLHATNTLGFSSAGLPRVTIGASLDVFPSAPTPNNTGTINLWDQFSAHTVGLMAPDFVGNSFRIRLPAVPGSSGQCLVTDGGFPNSTWSYAACGSGGGGGGGGTVTNTGVLGLNQIIVGDGGVAIKGLGTLGTSTTVLHGNAGGLPVFGQVIVADIGATGTPNSSTFLRGDGTWAAPSGSGTVTTSGSPVLNNVSFFTSPTVISGSAGFQFDNALKRATIAGLGQSTSAYNPTSGNLGASLRLMDDGGSAGNGGVLLFGVGSFGAWGAIKGMVTNATGPLGSLAFSVRNLTGDAALTERLRIDSTGLHTMSGQLLVQPAIDAPVTNSIFVNTTVSATTGVFDGLLIRANSSGNMTDGFGPGIGFAALDQVDSVHNAAGHIYFTRSGIDGTYRGAIATAIAGAMGERIIIDNLGQVLFGSPVLGTQAQGPVKIGVNTTDNVNPYQVILAQSVNGTITPGPATLLNDKVAVSGHSFRGTGGTSPVYGGHFTATFSTTGVANGIEIGVQNNSGTSNIGQGLWVNGNGTNNRSNAILIDTQNVTKWDAGIRFTEGNVGAGATGSVVNYGIIFDKSNDLDFIVIRPRIGTFSNIAFRITDPAFSANRFSISNNGEINTNGNINSIANIGAQQYFSGGLPGFGAAGVGTTKVAGACTFTIAGGLIVNVTGC